MLSEITAKISQLEHELACAKAELEEMEHAAKVTRAIYDQDRRIIDRRNPWSLNWRPGQAALNDGYPLIVLPITETSDLSLAVFNNQRSVAYGPVRVKAGSVEIYNI